MCVCKLWLLCVLFSCVYEVTSFNVDSFNCASYNGPPLSMFGFSIAVHKESNNGWLIVGAPEAQSSVQPGVYQGGAVYKCPTDRDGSCQEIPFDTTGDNHDLETGKVDNKTQQWFGATVSSASSDSGPIVACAPRYTWYPKRKNRRDPVGTCYVSDGRFNHFNEYSPCRTYQWGYHRQGSCQAGFSAAINSVGDRLFIGSPGSWYWQGQMYSIDAHVKFEFKPQLFSSTYGAKGQVHQQSLETRPAVFSTVEGTEKDDDSYMGYSTIVGDFLGTGDEGIAVGMPRGNNLRGKVLLFTWNLTNVLHHFTSDQLGSYYGYALATSDVDGDGKVDLIIGAPMYTIQNNEGKYDVGRVYVVYHNSERGRFVATYEIDGFNTKSRFGQALASLGDINQDGFGDFAVGAPYDGPDQRGAVYIYHGSEKGIRKKFSQVIYAEDVVAGPAGPVTTFGFAITGGLDLDGNEYPDMAVGAYLTNNAFFFRSRPVVRVEANVRFLTANKEVDIKQSNYMLRSGARATRTQIDFCIKYFGKGIPSYIELDLQYILDSKKLTHPRMGFVELENQNTFNDTIRIYKDQSETCIRKDVYVLTDIRDKLTALVAEVKYWMKDGSAVQQNRSPRSVLRPILDLNSPPSRKDSISVHKDCGNDNICIPNLVLTVKPSVDKYLLGSKEHMFLDVVVANTGEDSFETTLEVKYPENVFYVNTKDEKVETHVLCNTYENNTLKCEIGNPIPKDKVVHFKIFWQPTYKKQMSATYDFYLLANSTNQESDYTFNDNKRNISVGIWSNSHLEVRGKSHPGEIFFNASLYTEDISKQTKLTKPEERLEETVIGPQVVHLYYLRNEGPASIEETEIVFAWPAYTLAGEDFLYLLEPPHFSTKGKVQCDAIPANSKGFDITLSNKSIWEKLNLNIEGETQGLTSNKVQSTVGFGTDKDVDSVISKAVEASGDSTKVQEERQNKISSGGTIVRGNNGEIINSNQNTQISGNGYSHTVYSNQTHFRNASGVYVSSTGKMVSRGQGSGFGQGSGQFNGNHFQQGGSTQQGGTYVQGGSSQQGGIYAQGGSSQPGGTYVQGGSSQQGGTYSQGGSTQHGGTYAQGGSSQQGGSTQHGGTYGQGGSSSQQGGTYSQGGSTQQGGTYAQGGSRQQGGSTQHGGTYGQGGSSSQQGETYSQGGSRQQGGTYAQGGSSSQQGGTYSQGGSRQQGGAYAQGGSSSQQGGIYSQGGSRQQGGTYAQGGSSQQGGTYVQGGSSQQGGGAYNQGGNTYAQGGTQANGKFVYRCLKRINGVEEEVDCGPNFTFPALNSTWLGHGAQTGEVQTQCFEEVNGAWKPVDCALQNKQFGGRVSGGGTSTNANVRITHKCREEVNGQWHEVPCAANGGFADFNSSAYQSQYGGRLVPGSSGYRLIHECYQTIDGVDHKIDCGSVNATGAFQQGSQRGGSTYQNQASGGQYSQGSNHQQNQASQYEQRGGSSYNQGRIRTQSEQDAEYQRQLAEYQRKKAEYKRGGSQNSQQGSSEYEDEYEEEEESGKAISGYLNSNEGSQQTTQGRRDPKTYGKYHGQNSGATTGLEGAALGNDFRVTTLDLGNIGGNERAQSSGAAQGNNQNWRQESHWSETHQVPPQHENTVERDNVPTDRPTGKNRFYGRKKRQVFLDPSFMEIRNAIPCKSVQCVYMRCTVENLENNEVVSIALRARINARVLKNVSSSEPLSFSSVMAARISKIPYIEKPVGQEYTTYEVSSTVSRNEAEIKPDVVPLWVIVLSAVAGTIILLLLVFLLYKVGFFKRDRPSVAPERQPLNRNGYHHGDEAL